jgi:hypothetical protein
MAMARVPPHPVDELPLDLSQVLDEEDRVLHERGGGAGPEPLPGWRLADDQIANPAELIARLQGGTAVGRYFLSRLLEPTQRALKAAKPGHAPSLVPSLVQDLNALLAAERLLYDEAALPDVRLDADLRELIALSLTGEDRLLVNRLLLERAFPGVIERIYDVRLGAFYRRLHARTGGDLRQGRWALCVSGGGIRSATFGLGILQGLARRQALERFHFLSTVSGGGYVGSWLTSWIHRHRGGTAGVTRELANLSPRSPVMPEPKPVHHLREYSNYLSPRLGLLSADTWTLVATYLRNLLLNWTVLVPLLVGILAVPRLVGALALLDPPAGWRRAVLAVGVVALLLAVVYIGVFRPSLEESRRHLPGRLRRCGSQGWFLTLCLAPLIGSAIALTTYWAWVSPTSPTVLGLSPMWGLVILGAGLHILGWAVHSALLRRRLAGELGLLHLIELVISAATGGLAGLLLGLAATRLPAGPVAWFVELYVCLAVPGFIVAFLFAATAFVGLVSRWTSDEDREWWARLGAWALIAALAWVVGCALVILGPLALAASWARLVSSLSVGSIAGLVAVLLGRSGKTPGGARGGAATASLLLDHAATVAAPIALAVIGALLSRITTAALAPLVPCPDGAAHAPPLPVLPDAIGHRNVLHCTPAWLAALVVVAPLAVAVVGSYFINVNKFSLHAMYRARLIRAYLGASRGRRQPNPFTGFDPLDNIQMHELRDEAFNPGSFKDLSGLVSRLKAPQGDPVSMALRRRLSRSALGRIQVHVDGASPSPTLERQLLEDLNRILDAEDLDKDPAFEALAARVSAAGGGGPERPRRNRALLEAAYPIELVPQGRPRRPLHVLNMALNLVAGRNLAWQERKAETFTVTELHAGSYHVGYRRSRDYGGQNPRGISLGTAIAISGAAASPNMGYHSSPVVTFLMTLFNARLGWWLGNPGPRGRHTFRLGTPRVSLVPMLREGLGLTDDEYAYVYLSDGGHFDNLGLLEMVLRRCHLIVVSDAGWDPKCTFEDLGNAIRKVRIDLGVPIRLRQELRIRPRAGDGARPRPGDGVYFAVAVIKYSDVDPQGVDGRLVYVKPCFYGDEPIDVLNYALAHPAFPHESTRDQFFSESQFESYRQLGLHTMTTVWPDSHAAPGEPESPAGPPPGRT